MNNKLCECGCGFFVKQPHSRFARGHASRTQETKNKNKQSCLKHYGTEFSFQVKEVIEKSKQTLLNNFGVTNPMNSKKIRDKFKNTMIKNYGVEHALQSDQCKEKKKQTNLKIFGCEDANQSDLIKKNKKLTCLQHFGVDNPMKSDVVQQTYKQTFIEKYGVDHPLKLKSIREKRNQTMMNKHGCLYPMQSKKFREVYKQTSIKNHGIDHFFKTPQGRQDLRIRRIKETAVQISNGNSSMPCIGKTEQMCLDALQQHTTHNIIRNDSSFRYIVGRFPDGHIPYLKLFIQFDEFHHFEDKLSCKIYKQDDINCTVELASLGYIVFRVSELDWINNKEKVILDFKELIKELELLCVGF